MTVTTRGLNGYDVDGGGFLRNPGDWDEDFASLMAPQAGITEGLTSEHWQVIRAIRRVFDETGRCPLVYQTCRAVGLGIGGLEALFPTGYLRGACRLAGLTFRAGFPGCGWANASLAEIEAAVTNRSYRVDAWGFLVDPFDWDEGFAAMKALETKMAERLGDRHWQVIRFLRGSFERNGAVPTVYETCTANDLDLDELELLFPDGYHRGAVKVAGLCVR
jgi:tRNA 2-thiouridine synthesizing protein E